jgi:hypothetical protein
MERLPIQPIYTDEQGISRFRENKIVRHLLDNGGIDLNEIARLQFPNEDREQFAQLIGYSISGFGELSYVSDETFEAAFAMSKDSELTEQQARLEYLETIVAGIREDLKAMVPRVFKIHPCGSGNRSSRQ